MEIIYGIVGVVILVVVFEWQVGRIVKDQTEDLESRIEDLEFRIEELEGDEKDEFDEEYLDSNE